RSCSCLLSENLHQTFERLTFTTSILLPPRRNMLRVPTLYAALHKFAMGIIAPHKRLARCLSKSGGTGSGFRWRSIISYVFRIPSYHGDDRRAFEVTAVSLESSSAI